MTAIENDVGGKPETVSISPLLNRLAYPATGGTRANADDIASAFALIFENRLSDIQTAALLTLLHSTGQDRNADVIAKCSRRMREAACPIEKKSLQSAVKKRGQSHGNYHGGLCDIVGTGGDAHSTYNVSTTASIIASAFLVTAKHGNRAQTSFSGSADLLRSIAPIAPNIDAVTAENIAQVYEKTNYSFLYAPNFHPAMAYASAVRRGLGLRTIFNLMGPLANPIEWGIEARVVGVAYQALGPVFVDALKQAGSKKALVVCGEEDMDEISCAGPTNCWRITSRPNPDYNSSEDDDESSEDEENPPNHQVHGRKMPEENARKLMTILRNELPSDSPLLEFVLMNVAALLVTSGICESDNSNMGPGDDGKVITERGPGGGRWKEGLRRARWAIESGKALERLEQFIEVTNKL
ncbi:uncharacterized protein N7483_004486 [Penicillium malachiteum]|uniref:uncharacterized protein n=1 Tax=Penicillium malachiteum TaxID=1324776 RepID=UPI002548931D|nr:uncharacterized protein N7483_004486 [Penicillium malachiteum]KAJ5729978.1 hypothetical protein N7483_004486 [Penicillium malachiteum]